MEWCKNSRINRLQTLFFLSSTSYSALWFNTPTANLFCTQPCLRAKLFATSGRKTFIIVDGGLIRVKAIFRRYTARIRIFSHYPVSLSYFMKLFRDNSTAFSGPTAIGGGFINYNKCTVLVFKKTSYPKPLGKDL
jgi:hypothetical protein